MADPTLVTTSLPRRWNRRHLLRTTAAAGAVGTGVAGLTSALPGVTPRVLGAQVDGNTFTILISIGAEDIDPHYSYATLSSTVALAAYDMLIQFDGEKTDAFAPMLAESWEISDDQTSYTFHLVPGALFHDGTAADAQAVKDSYTRFLQMESGPYLVLARFVPDPEMMEVVDAATIRFNLGEPQPLFLSAMASQYGPSVVSPTAIAANATEEDPFAHEFFTVNAVGSGPYQLVENTLNERLVFQRFPDYHGGWEGNHFDTIVFRVVPEEPTRRQLVEQGEADAVAYGFLSIDNKVAMEGNPDLNIVTYPSTAVSWVIMNAVRLPTVEARQGFSYVYPYQEVVDGVYQGLITRNGPIADTLLGYDPDIFMYETDFERAKELIVAGGFAEGTTFSYMFDGSDDREALKAQLFQANLSQIGFNLDLQAVDYAALENVIFGELTGEERPDFIPWGWWPDYNDPWNQLAPTFLESAIGNGGGNAGLWVNPRFEELMAIAEASDSSDEIVEVMKEIQNIVTEVDPPAIWIGQPEYYTILRASIEGFVPNPLYLEAYRFYDLSRVTS